MHSTPKLSDDPCDVVVLAPDAVPVAPSDEELSHLLHQAARHRSGTQTGTASDSPARPTAPPVERTFRPAAVNDVLASGDRSSMGRSAIRLLIALLLVTCIGFTAIVWKAYGDNAKKKIAKLATQFILTSSLPPEKPAIAAQPAPPAEPANASPQPAPLAQTAAEAIAPAADAPSPAVQLVHATARDLASLRQEVEQLKASMEQLQTSQQQISRDVAKAAEQSVRTRATAPAPRSAAAAVRRPMPSTSRPAQAAAAPALQQAAAPYYVPRQLEPQPQTLAEPELSPVPRPPMPVR
jgi:chemotaxis protein histidine kinase CheA